MNKLIGILPVSGAISLLAMAGCAGGASTSPNEVATSLRSWNITETRIGLSTELRRTTDPVDSQNLRALVDYALEHNPEIQAAHQQYLGALERVPQATALPDPKLTWRYFFEEVETRVGPQEHAIGISQALPWLGKLRLQEAAATNAALGAAQRVASVRNGVIAEVARAWYELYYLGQSIEIVRGNRDLVLHLERVARARYGAGAATHSDVIRAQVELGTIENRLASLEDRRAPLSAQLNSALNRPTTELLALPMLLEMQTVAFSDADLLDKVALNNPELRATAYAIEAAKSLRQRANKNYLPDFTVGVDYIAVGEARMPGVNDSGKNALSAVVGVTLPIWRSKYDAGGREAASVLKREQYKRDQQLNALHADTVMALFKLRDAQRQIDLYENTLLPKANESLVATQRAYSAGTTPFADMIDSQRVLLNFELSYARSVTDHNQARTILEKLTGQPLTATAQPQESAHEHQ